MGRVDASFKGCKVRLPRAASRANLRHPASKINMRSEMGFVKKVHRRHIARQGNRKLIERSRAVRAERTIKI